MKRSVRYTIVTAAALAVAACSNLAGNRSASVVNPALTVAFSTVPVGYSSTQNSYDTTAAPLGAGWYPGAPLGGLGRHEGPSLGRGFGGLLGGGIGRNFLGGLGLGWGFGHGRFGDGDLDGDSCAFDAGTGRVACAPITHNGLTITTSASFTDAAGVVQSAFDSLTTDTINTRFSVSGTRTRRDSSTTTVGDTSTRTIGGVKKGSTEHSVNGMAWGTETTNGTDSVGTFVAVRTVGDTISGVIVPVLTTGHTYPTAGTIIRSMSVSLTYSGGTPQTSSRREVITYDGSATAQLVITQNGVTKTCTLPLPFGRPSCP